MPCQGHLGAKERAAGPATGSAGAQAAAVTLLRQRGGAEASLAAGLAYMQQHNLTTGTLLVKCYMSNVIKFDFKKLNLRVNLDDGNRVFVARMVRGVWILDAFRMIPYDVCAV